MKHHRCGYKECLAPSSIKKSHVRSWTRHLSHDIELGEFRPFIYCHYIFSHAVLCLDHFLVKD